MQAIDTRNIKASEPSRKVVLAAMAGLLALLCLLVLVSSALNGGTSHPASSGVKTVAAQPAAGGSTGSGESRPDHGYIP